MPFSLLNSLDYSYRVMGRFLSCVNHLEDFFLCIFFPLIDSVENASCLLQPCWCLRKYPHNEIFWATSHHIKWKTKGNCQKSVALTASGFLISSHISLICRFDL